MADLGTPCLRHTSRYKSTRVAATPIQKQTKQQPRKIHPLFVSLDYPCVLALALRCHTTGPLGATERKAGFMKLSLLSSAELGDISSHSIKPPLPAVPAPVNQIREFCRSDHEAGSNRQGEKQHNPEHPSRSGKCSHSAFPRKHLKAKSLNQSNCVNKEVNLPCLDITRQAIVVMTLVPKSVCIASLFLSDHNSGHCRPHLRAAHPQVHHCNDAVWNREQS